MSLGHVKDIQIQKISYKMASSTTSPPHSNNNNDITFGHEDLLPPLPLPTLDGTCKKLLRSLTPLCPTQKEYINVAKKIADFKTAISSTVRSLSNSMKEASESNDIKKIKMSFNKFFILFN